MLTLDRLLDDAAEAETTLTLPFELRQRSRLKAELDDGREIGLFLPRGTVLRDGDLLGGPEDLVVRVRAAREGVSTVASLDHWLLARAAYHLGNRHVPLDIAPGRLRYLYDHVLDDMIIGLGLEPRFENAPFEPESGAYHPGGAHHHAHDH